MRIPSKSILLLLGVLFLLSLFINLGVAPLEFEEPRRALIAQEMEESGNLIVPTQIGELYHKKPPVFNWVLLGSTSIFGQTEFAYRLVTVLSMLFMGFLIYRWVARRHSKELGFFSAVSFLVSAHLYFYLSMLAEIDMFYSAITLWMIIILYDGFVDNRPGYMYLAGYGLCAVGILTKGLPSIVFIALTLFALWIIGRFRFARFLRVQHAGGLLIALILVGGYFYLYSKQADLKPYFEGLWSQSSERTPMEHSTLDTITGIFGNVLMFLKDMMPVSVFLPLIFFRKVRAKVMGNTFLKHVLVLFLINLIPYLISPGSRSRYLMMLYPLGIIFLTGLIYEGWKAYKHLNSVIIGYAVIVFVALSGAAIYSFTYEKVSIVEDYQVFSSVLLILSACGAVLLVKSPKSAMVWLFFGLIGVRFALNFFFIPIKAEEGEMAQVRRDAYELAELTKGENLWLWKPEHDRSFSLGMAYYLNMKRDQILKMDIPCNNDDYFIVHQGEAKGTEFKVYHTFEWKEHQYLLIKFTSCGDE